MWESSLISKNRKWCTTLRARILSVPRANYQPHRELKARDDRAFGYAGAEEPLVLLPLEVMVKPLELRFRYHFDGDKPTNRLDKVRQIRTRLGTTV